MRAIENGPKTGKMRLVYLPLDERPCNYLFAPRIAKGSPIELVAPPREMLGDKKTPANVRALGTFLLDSAAVNTVIAEYPKFAESERVVLIYYGVEFDDLADERGRPYRDIIDRRTRGGDPSDYLDSHLYDGYKDTDTICINNNFRLANRDKYPPLEIEGPKFKTGFAVFTAIKDVDKYLRTKRMEGYV